MSEALVILPTGRTIRFEDVVQPPIMSFSTFLLPRNEVLIVRSVCLNTVLLLVQMFKDLNRQRFSMSSKFDSEITCD